MDSSCGSVGVPMKAIFESSSHESENSLLLAADPIPAEEIQQELNRILASRFFRSAGRSRQFLQYVVQHKLEGHPELLKERTIGTEVFQRPAGYATGDDPVVRVQAGEVRRRLEQYYQSGEDSPVVSIELPVGSYSPSFHWASERPVADEPKAHSSIPAPSVPPPQAFSPAQPQISAPPVKARSKSWILAAVCIAVLLVAGLGLYLYQRNVHQLSTLERFWNPVFATQQPVLICLAKPVTYRPSQELYRRYERTNP